MLSIRIAYNGKINNRTIKFIHQMDVGPFTMTHHF